VLDGVALGSVVVGSPLGVGELAGSAGVLVLSGAVEVGSPLGVG
jgi:hypothetical protein